MADKEKRKKKKSDRLLSVLIVVFAAVFVFSGFMFAKSWLQGEKEQEFFEDLASDMPQMVEGDVTAEDAETLLAYYGRLKEKNSDFIGWIKIPGTKLDYPVMHTPENPEYYLRRTFEGSYAISGTPFMDAACNEDSRLVMIYGHHMNNGTMFATLHNYKNKDYWEQHPEICFDTLTQIRTYEVVSAFYTEIRYDAEREGLFEYYKYIGDVTDESFDEYVKGITEASVYDSGVEITQDDKLITLSTCSYHHENGRFVLVAKLKDVKTVE